jgi:hypothetical protein
VVEGWWNAEERAEERCWAHWGHGGG